MIKVIQEKAKKNLYKIIQFLIKIKLKHKIDNKNLILIKKTINKINNQIKINTICKMKQKMMNQNNL